MSRIESAQEALSSPCKRPFAFLGKLLARQKARFVSPPGLRPGDKFIKFEGLKLSQSRLPGRERFKPSTLLR
jgi:hypothetical protein